MIRIANSLYKSNCRIIFNKFTLGLLIATHSVKNPTRIRINSAILKKLFQVKL